MRNKNTAAAAFAVSFLMLCGCAGNDVKDVSSKNDSLSENTSTADNITDDPKKETDPIVEFSAESGFYDEEFALELKCAEKDMVIRYTTDGSIPNENSAEYTSPIMLTDKEKNEAVLANHTDITGDNDYTPPIDMDVGCVVRAAAFSQDGEHGPVESHSYFIGFDRANIYGDVPIISIMVDEKDLFDYERGIYCLGKYHDQWLEENPANKALEGWQHIANYSQTGREWERPVYTEYITSDNTIGFGQDMGIRIMGAATRNENQKSLRLTAREEYGKKNVKYPLIPDNERSDKTGVVEKYKSFILRNGGNDCNFLKYKDVLLQSLVADKDFETLQGTPAVAFINGEFWGVYSLMEDYSDNYIENNYGIDNKNVVIVKVGEIEEGEPEDIKLYTDMYDFITNNDMSDDENYKKAESMIDMQSFCDHMAFNVYIGNEDGILRGANWRMWRVRQADSSSTVGDGKWRMMAYDCEYSTGLYSGGEGYQDNYVRHAVKGDIDTKDIDDPPADIFRKLLENDKFKEKFILALCDMRNISFEKNRVHTAFDEYDKMYSKLAGMTFERFGEDYAKPMYGVFKNHALKYLDGRHDLFMKHISNVFDCGETASVTLSVNDAKKGGMIVNTTAADLKYGEISCDYFKDIPITIKAEPKSGKFVKWECEGCTVSDENSDEITVNIDGDCSITAIYE